jgi:hypothetical protein
MVHTVHGQNVSATKCIRTKRIGPITYRLQNVSATKRIGDQTYRQTKRIGYKTYRLQYLSANKTYRLARGIWLT